MRRVPAFRCGDCGTEDSKGGIGPAPCRHCGRPTLRVEYALYQATPALLRFPSGGPPRPQPANGLVLDGLTDADRAVPLKDDRGGAVTAARATAFNTAQATRDWAPRAGVAVAVVGIIAATWIELHQPGSLPATPSPPTTTAASSAAVAPSSAGMAPAVLYASEAQARAHCGAQDVVFANTRSRIWHLKGDRYYGIWNRTPFPAKGYGCADELDKAGYRQSR